MCILSFCSRPCKKEGLSDQKEKKKKKERLRKKSNPQHREGIKGEGLFWDEFKNVGS